MAHLFSVSWLVALMRIQPEVVAQEDHGWGVIIADVGVYIADR